MLLFNLSCPSNGVAGVGLLLLLLQEQLLQEDFVSVSPPMNTLGGLLALADASSLTNKSSCSSSSGLEWANE